MARAGNKYIPKTHQEIKIEPFQSVEQVWFWFVQAYTARQDGARVTAGAGTCNRPCEPVDIMVILDKLHRNRRLLIDHMKVLKHYGVRQLPPDPYRVKEARAATLWQEAMAILEESFISKNILMPVMRDAGIHQNTYRQGQLI